MPKELLCPFCYQTFDPEEVHWRCAGPKCGARSLVDERLKVYVQEVNPGAAPPVKPPSYTTQTRQTPVERLLGRKLRQRCPEPDCGRESTQKLCPHCHNDLPFSLETSDSRIVAIVGSKESSKSHYIAVLAQELDRLGAAYGFSLMRVDDVTRNVIRTMQNRLYREKKTLSATQIGLEQPRPLMFRITFRGQPPLNAPRSLMLVFFDAAGEIFDAVDAMGVRSRYLDHAAAVLLLVDPLQIPRLHDELQGRGVPLPSLDRTSPAEILERLIELKERRSTSRLPRKIKEPFALAFSKIDALRDFGKLGANDPLYSLPRHESRFDPEVQRAISDHLKAFYQQQDPDGNSVEQNLQAKFENYAYFGVSALGSSPDASGSVHSVNPFRVEDPFLWILRQLGYIG